MALMKLKLVPELDLLWRDPVWVPEAGPVVERELLLVKEFPLQSLSTEVEVGAIYRYDCVWPT